MSFADFFQAATGDLPYDHQRRLACGEPATEIRPSGWPVARNAILDSSTSRPVSAKPPPLFWHGSGIASLKSEVPETNAVAIAAITAPEPE
jgi:hypothetical protein